MDFKTITGVVDNGIANNKFYRQAGSGLLVEATNNSNLQLNIFANSFGDDPLTPTVTSGNLDDGIRINADGGITNIMIGGAVAALGNVFGGNLENGIVLNLTGASVNTVDIGFNTLALGGASGGGGNIFLTGHDVDFHQGQAGFDSVILDFLRGVGSANAIPSDQYSLAVIGSGSGNWSFSDALGVQVKPGYQSTTFFDTDNLTTNPALWDQVFASDAIIILSHSTVGGGDLSDAGVVEINSQAARFSTAISSGVDVWANAGSNNPNYYNFLPPGAVATGVPLVGANGFVATPAGVLIGITDVAPNSMINGYPTHNSFASTDPVFTVFETRTLNGITETVSLGARNATITNGGFGTAQPGTDAIRVNIADTAIVTTANIHDNTIAGYGVSGIHAVSNDTAQFQNLTIQNNTVTGSGDGISVERNDASFMNAIINNNTATGNSHSGLSIVGTGTDTPLVMVSLTDNTFTGNVGNGLFTHSADAAVVSITSIRDNFSQNTGDNIHGEAEGTSVTQLNLINVTSDSSGGNGLSVLTTESGEYYLRVTSPTDPLFTSAPRSSFSRNTLNGLLFSPRDTSLISVEIDDTNILTNTLNGLAFNRFGAGLFVADVTNSAISGNTVNGIQVTGLGSDPADPNQKLTGTPNTLTLLDVAVDRNGTAATFGNGFRADLFGDMAFVLDATRTTFNSNAGNGIRVETGPGAAFGYEFGGVRSVLDGVTIAGNTQNGIQIVSNISTTPNTDPESRTFMEINSNTANTLISNNGLNGILLQYPGGTHDLLIQGDTNPAAPANTTIIRANALDGLHVDTGVFATSLVTVDNVLIGGATAADGNGGDGIDFDVTSRFRVLDGATNTTWLFNTAGLGTLNVNNSTIRNNGGHGINLLGQGFRSFGFGAFDGSAADEPFQNFDTDPFGQINANITSSTITDNALNGVNIDLRGAMGGDHRNFNLPNSLVFDGNLIASNGQHGVFLESNAGQQIRGGNTHRRIEFNDIQPTNPPFPYDPTNVLANDWNTGDNTDISGGAFLSNYLNLRTDQATDLVFTNNRVQFNGTATVLGEGVYLRVGTDSYLSADIRDNTIVGNLGNDLKIESFVAYNRQTGVAIPVPPSVAANPGPDVVFLDDSAQLDLRISGNTANSANIVSPFNNGGGLLGTATPNGAVYPGDFFKNNFGGNIQPRLTQLFQVDDGNNLGSNVFTTNGVVQNLSNSFFNASFHLGVAANPLFPDPAFPEDFFTDPGDPFLP